MSAQHQLDLFAPVPVAAPRIAASAPKVTAPTIGHERTRVVTEDMPCLVVDGLKNLTYFVQ